MYLHKELCSVHPPKALLWFSPIRAEVHVNFAAPPALSACSHPGPTSVKCDHAWHFWHLGDATDIRWKQLSLQCSSEAPFWTRGQILIAWRYNLRQVSCYLRDFSRWPRLLPDLLFLATVYELLFVSNLGLSSCFPHLRDASTFKSPVSPKHWFPTNKVKEEIKHPNKVVLSHHDGFRWPTQHPDLKRTKWVSSLLWLLLAVLNCP